MAADKTSWTELRRAVANRIGAEEKEVALFLNTLVPQLIEALRTERLVRINGLGTFKLQQVAPRKSVNVATGETFVIEGYNKVSFSPEPAIRDLINHQPVPEEVRSNIDEVIDPIQKLGAQAAEIVDILAELGQDPRKQPASPNTSGSPESSARMGESGGPEDSNDDAVVSPCPKEPNAQVTNSEAVQQPKGSSISRPWLTAGITILCFTLLLAGAFLFAGHRFVQWVDDLHERSNTELPQPAAQQPEIQQPKGLTKHEVTDTQSPTAELINSEAPQHEVTNTQSPTAEPDYSDILAVEELHPDSRLAWVAYKYYGNKDLWVFIYEANRDVLPNPHVIKTGTPIRIPRLSPELLDTNNPETRQLIEQKIALYGH